MIVLPEMYATGFSMDAAEICEPEDGASIEFVRDAARRLDVWIAASVAVATKTTGNRNRFIAAGPNGEFVTYDKRHPFTYAGEHREFTPGDDVVRFEIDGLRVTPFVCYDLRFADDFWQAGPTTDLFLVVANWPSSRRHHWSSLLVARAIENQCYVVGVNRVGEEGGFRFIGQTRLADVTGDLLAVCDHDREDILLADIDPERARQKRSVFIKGEYEVDRVNDRRPEMYDVLSKCGK